MKQQRVRLSRLYPRQLVLVLRDGRDLYRSRIIFSPSCCLVFRLLLEVGIVVGNLELLKIIVCNCCILLEGDSGICDFVVRDFPRPALAFPCLLLSIHACYFCLVNALALRIYRTRICHCPVVEVFRRFLFFSLRALYPRLICCPSQFQHFEDEVAATLENEEEAHFVGIFNLVCVCVDEG